MFFISWLNLSVHKCADILKARIKRLSWSYEVDKSILGKLSIIRLNKCDDQNNIFIDIGVAIDGTSTSLVVMISVKSTNGLRTEYLANYSNGIGHDFKRMFFCKRTRRTSTIIILTFLSGWQSYKHKWRIRHLNYSRRYQIFTYNLTFDLKRMVRK